MKVNIFIWKIFSKIVDIEPNAVHIYDDFSWKLETDFGIITAEQFRQITADDNDGDCDEMDIIEKKEFAVAPLAIVRRPNKKRRLLGRLGCDLDLTTSDSESDTID